MRRKASSVLGAIVLFVVACGSSGRGAFQDQSAQDGGPGGAGFSGAQCQAGGKTCVGNDVYECQADGGTGAFVTSCDDTGEFCLGGVCSSGCDAADSQPSNVGCEFWAVDLDNEYSQFNDAAGQPWGVVVSNFGKTDALVVIEKNDGALGAPASLAAVTTLTLAPGTLKEIELPTREVDGSTSADNGPGTFVSPNAFRIRSTAPVVVYQFNTMHQSYSNDASLLLPAKALGTKYRVLGWPTTNPISAGLVVAGIPDHSYVTIIGTEPGTKVTVTLGGPIVGGGGVSAGVKGDTVVWNLEPFDVLNLESTGIPGDMTGTIVESSAPVAVFTGGERGIAPMDDKATPPPSYDAANFCCTDHLEEQLLPITSYGKKFVISRSPIRSTGSYVEPDVLRFMGVAAPTAVKTSLPAPNDSFTLQPGEVRDAYTTTDIVVEATEPLAVAQILVSAGFTESPSAAGDPSLTIFPPVDQYRRDYLFNVPTSWQNNYVVVAQPVGAKVTIDGAPLPASCIVASAGSVDGKTWEAHRCPIGDGPHRMTGDAAFGIVAYGYALHGSYAFVGGANVRKIYEPPPLR